MSMKKNSSDTIGNRMRDLPVFSAVPQPLRHQQRAPNWKYTPNNAGRNFGLLQK
jgi:hypothetical protein